MKRDRKRYKKFREVEAGWERGRRREVTKSWREKGKLIGGKEDFEDDGSRKGWDGEGDEEGKM